MAVVTVELQLLIINQNIQPNEMISPERPPIRFLLSQIRENSEDGNEIFGTFCRKLITSFD